MITRPIIPYHPAYGWFNDGKETPSFPPKGWEVLQQWGDGWALREPGGLRVLLDVSRKADDRAWLHVSLSRAKRLPSWDDVKKVKADFIGDRVAIIVFPEESDYVNIHPYCHHLWHCLEGETCVNFTGEIGSVKSI